MTHFHADCQDVHLPLLLVDVVQQPEAIVWPEPDLPRGIERGRLHERLAIPRFNIGLVEELLLDRLANQRMVLGLDGAKVLFHLDRVDQRIAPPPSHDDYNSGQSSPVMSSSDHPSAFRGQMTKTHSRKMSVSRAVVTSRWRSGSSRSRKRSAHAHTGCRRTKHALSVAMMGCAALADAQVFTDSAATLPLPVP